MGTKIREYSLITHINVTFAKYKNHVSNFDLNNCKIYTKNCNLMGKFKTNSIKTIRTA